MMVTGKPPTGRQDRMSEKKPGLFGKMAEAAIAYKEAHTSEDAATSGYGAARKATEAYAEFSGISYERAARLAPEIVNC